jgi:hypothetical protein
MGINETTRGMTMAQITIEYNDGTAAHWEMSDAEVEQYIEPRLGSPLGMRC